MDCFRSESRKLQAALHLGEDEVRVGLEHGEELPSICGRGLRLGLRGWG